MKDDPVSVRMVPRQFSFATPAASDSADVQNVSFWKNLAYTSTAGNGFELPSRTVTWIQR